MRIRLFDDEPTQEDLAEIQREWPLIEAEMALLDAEIVCLVNAVDPNALDWHRLRRAEAHVLRELRKFQTATGAAAAVAA